MEILLLLNAGALAISLLRTLKCRRTVEMISSAIPFEPGYKGICKVITILESKSPILKGGESFITLETSTDLEQAPLVPSQQHLKYFIPIIHKLNKDTFGQAGIRVYDKRFFTVIAPSDGLHLMTKGTYLVSTESDASKLFVKTKRKYKKAMTVSIVCAISLVASFCTCASRN